MVDSNASPNYISPTRERGISRERSVPRLRFGLVCFAGYESDLGKLEPSR
jgi:hypothetical protein